MNTANILRDESTERVFAKRAMKLWRRVLAQLIIDYFQDYKGAEEQVIGPSLKYLCGIVGLNAENTRQEIIQAKKDFLASGKTVSQWRNERYNKEVRCRVDERYQHKTDNVGALVNLMRDNRVQKACPEYAERLRRNRYEWTSRQPNKRKRKKTNRIQNAPDHHRVRDFYQKLWGKKIS